MSTSHGRKSTAQEIANQRRQLILVVSGESSPQVAEHLSAEIGVNYIGGTSILRECNENSDQVKELATVCQKISEHTGIAILTLPEYTFPLKQLREAVPKDVDVRFIICEDDDGAGALEEKGVSGCRFLRVIVNEEHGGAENVVRKIEAELWGAGS